jgi:hypothetical protein
MIAPQRSIHDDSNLLAAIRELHSRRPTTAQSSPDTIARLLCVLRYLPYPPNTFEVEVALNALIVEGVILP